MQKQRYVDSAFQERYAAWRTEDPVGALASFQRNAQAISPLVRVQLYHELFEASAPSLAQQINAAGGPSVGVAGPAPDGSPQPRGVRNNNPGNLIRGGSAWLGETPGSDPKYVSFDTPEAGIRAMGRTLQNYQASHGLNTVAGIVSRWAPAAENDTASYIQTVAKALNVKPDDPIDLGNMPTLTGMTKAIIQVENGRQPYSDAQIALGLNAVGGDVPPSATPRVLAGPAAVQRDAATPTGNPMVDSLPADWKLHVLQIARTQSQQDMATAREALRGRVQDASASYMTNGYAPNPPSLAEFVRAEGQVEGPAHYAQFQNVAVLGQHLQQVRTLPAAALADLATQAKPVPGPGFAAAEHNYNILTTAIDQTTALRQKDPIRFAIDTGTYGLKPLDFTAQKLSDQFAQRASAAAQIASDYGTAPALLSRDETAAMSAQLKGASVELQKSLLSAVAKGVNDMGALKATMQQIAPDQPVLALAGIYQARGNHTTGNVDTADLLLRGQAILTPDKKTDGTGHEGGASLVKMPEARLMLSEFNSQTGSAFAARPQAADLFMQATKAIYAAKSADEGDYSGDFNAKRWKQSIALSTGGVQNLNGSDIVMPYGMPLDRFQGILKDQAPSLAATAINVQPDELRRLPLENVGDGRYMFRRGSGYLVDKSGRPVVFSVSAQ